MSTVNQSSIDGKFKSKEYADANKDTTAAITKVNGLTKIFDLLRDGKEDEAVKRIRKLSQKRAQELFTLGKKISANVEFYFEVKNVY